MSKFPIPDHLTTNMNEFEKMSEDLTKMMPKEMAGAVNLFAHPAAGVAAMSALGVGLASQTFGLWLGALSGAAEASQRLFEPLSDHVPDAVVSDESGEPRVGKTATAPKARIADAPALAVVGAPASAEVMPEDFVQPQMAERPAQPDDLKIISGVGPKLEAALNGFGVWTYDQIAGWTAPEIAWMEDTLGFKGRVSRDKWIEQATELSEGKLKH